MEESAETTNCFVCFAQSGAGRGFRLVACSVSLLVAARTVQLRCHGRTLLATADLRPRLDSTNLGLNWSRPIDGPSIVSWDVLFVGKSDFPILRSGEEVLFIVQVHL